MTRTEAQRKDKSALLAELQAAGAKVRGGAVACPFHDDRHASGSVYEDEAGVWRFRCHAQECAFHGDLFDVRARATGRSVEDVLRDEAAGGPAKRREKRYRTIEDLRVAMSREGEIEAEYAYTNPRSGSTDLLIFRIRTPQGKTFRQCHVTTGGWMKRAGPKPWPLYRRREIADAEPVVVVEGEKCVHTLADAGVPATTSPCGAGKAEHCDWSPLAGKRCVLWPDNDIAGRNHMKQVAAILERLDPPPVVSMIEPNHLDLAEKQDAADFIARCTKAGMDDLKQAVTAAIAKARTLSVADKLKARIAENIAGLRRPVEWPWPCLSRLARAFVPGTVTLLCGTPGSTKSFLLLEAAAFWHEQGIKTAIYCLEEDLPYQLARVLAQRCGNSNLTREEWMEEHPDETSEAYEEHAEFLDSLGRRIWAAPEQSPTLAELARWCEARAQEGVRVMAIDPVSVAEPSAKPWVADAKFVNELKRLVRDYTTSLLLITHPKKGAGQGPGSLDDLAGGAAYQRLCQTAFWLQYHPKPVEELVAMDLGRTSISFNRTMVLLKTRNAEGRGLRLAYSFDPESLRTTEHGIIIGDK